MVKQAAMDEAHFLAFSPLWGSNRGDPGQCYSDARVAVTQTSTRMANDDWPRVKLLERGRMWAVWRTFTLHMLL